jgi:RNA polymerase sigma factor (sigma-70 family)
VEVVMGDELGGRAGDFSTIVGPWIEPGYRLAFSMLRDADEARDAVQVAAVKAWRSLGRLPDHGTAQGWFFGIVADQCRSTSRRRWSMVLRTPSIELPAAGPEQSLDLEGAIGRLSPDDRAILHLHYYLDLPMEEVARVLGIRPETGRTLLYSAAQRLRPDQDLMEDDLR